MLKIICLLLLFFGSCIMLSSIIVYRNTIKVYSNFDSTNRNFSKTAIFVMMVFFLIGYISTFFYISSLESLDMSLFLIAIIFFFGAIFCFSVVYVQSDLLRRLEMNATHLQEALDEANTANDALKGLNEELVNTMDALKHMQDQLVFSEKMSTLGKMMAGVSHEINTPLGIIRASTEILQSNLSENLPNLLGEIRKLSDSDFNDYLHYSKIAKANNRQFLTTSELRTLKREAKRILSQEEGFNDKIIDLLSTSYLLDDESVQSFKTRLSSDTLEQVLSLVGPSCSIDESINNISVSVEKVIKLSSSLKSFSHINLNNAKTRFSIVDSIGVVLSLYTNKLKYGIEVVTDFEDVGSIMGYEDDLNQVWSNMIENAIYAMAEGKKNIPPEKRTDNILTISVKKAENDYIAISINDNGQGIPLEKTKNIFEPFYTTKPVGIGSGLGLSITKQIIDKHNGSITIDSVEGKGTTFTILLPTS